MELLGSLGNGNLESIQLNPYVIIKLHGIHKNQSQRKTNTGIMKTLYVEIVKLLKEEGYEIIYTDKAILENTSCSEFLHLLLKLEHSQSD